MLIIIFFLFLKAPTHFEKIKSKSTRYLVAAIDFGTVYSGCAYSWTRKWSKIHINKSWNSGYFSSSKVSTSMLLKPNQTFLAFGYDAEEKYSRLAENDSDDDEGILRRENINDYYFFQRFKGLLYTKVSSLYNIIF